MSQEKSNSVEIKIGITWLITLLGTAKLTMEL
jgi:hypothetical protein